MTGVVAQPLSRRLHLRVGANDYLPVRLTIEDAESGWFGEAQLNELLSLLHRELPQLLPPVVAQRIPMRVDAEPCTGNTIHASVFFQPTAFTTWLVTTKQDSLTQVPYTLFAAVRLSQQRAAPSIKPHVRRRAQPTTKVP